MKIKITLKQNVTVFFFFFGSAIKRSTDIKRSAASTTSGQTDATNGEKSTTN